MKRIYLIDCPGVVPPSNNDTEEDILLRGVVRVENVENPEQYIPGVLKRVQPRHIERTYEIKNYKDAIDFLSILARKGGRLLRGGEPDVDGVAKMVINDFLRGKIPWYTPPPHSSDANADGKVEGRDGRLGEMGRKRKRDGSEAGTSAAPSGDAASESGDSDADKEEFEGLSEGDEDSASEEGDKADEDGATK